MEVIEGKFGPRPCTDLSKQLREIADAVDRNEIVDFIGVYVQNGEYQINLSASLKDSIVMSSLLQSVCVSKLIRG